MVSLGEICSQKFNSTFVKSQVGLLPLDFAVRREDAGDRSGGPPAPHQDTRQSGGGGQQAGVLPLGAKCSCVLQTGDHFVDFSLIVTLYFVDVANAFVE